MGEIVRVEQRPPRDRQAAVEGRETRDGWETGDGDERRRQAEEEREMVRWLRPVWLGCDSDEEQEQKTTRKF